MLAHVQGYKQQVHN